MFEPTFYHTHFDSSCFNEAKTPMIYNYMHLSDVILVESSLEPDPGFRLKVSDLFDHLEDVGHFLDGNHLLVPEAHAQVSYALNCRLYMSLLIGLNVDVALYMLRGYHRFYLQRL